MRTNKLDGMTRAAAGAALLAVMLTGCDKPAPETPPGPTSEPPAQTVPDTTPPAQAPSPDAAPAPPPADDAPPPTEPSVVPKPAASEDPAVESMLAAIPSTKMSVAVDLHYSFDGPVLPNQPVNVHLAAVPRTGGARLTVSVQEAPGLQIASAPLNVQKTSALGVYRQQFSLTKLAAETRQLRVLVITEVGESSGFGYFTIPLDTTTLGSGTIPQKQESVKQR